MKLVRISGDKRTFHLNKREANLLLAVLSRYPVIPPRHQFLSKSISAPDSEANRLLDEALAEQRQENRRQLDVLLNDEEHVRHSQRGCRLTLSEPELDWLLQVLNDVRVGSWIILGSPEKDLWEFELNDTTAPHALTMEMAGYFQMILLESLHGQSRPTSGP